jgi:hypothetical protein
MFKIEIATDNAAFDDDEGNAEIARILRELADRIERGDAVGDWWELPLRDVNGNRIGEARRSHA